VLASQSASQSASQPVSQSASQLASSNSPRLVMFLATVRVVGHMAPRNGLMCIFPLNPQSKPGSKEFLKIK